MKKYILTALAALSLAVPAQADTWTIGDQGAVWTSPISDEGGTRPTGAAPADAYEPENPDYPDGTDVDDWVGDTGDQGGTGSFRTADHVEGVIHAEKKIRLTCEPGGPARAKDNILGAGIEHFGHLHQGFGSVTWDENTTFETIRNDPVSTCVGGAANGTNYMEPALLATLPNGAKVAVRAQDQAIYYVEGNVTEENDMDWIRAGLRLVIGVKPTMFNDTVRRAAYAGAIGGLGLEYPGKDNMPAGFGGWYCNPGITSGTFTAATSDIATIAGAFMPSLITGTRVQVSNSGGSLPGGLAASTTYYIIRTGDTIEFATSLANAQAGTQIDITSTGSGTHTVSIADSAFVTRQESRPNETASWSGTARALAGPGGEDPWGGGCVGTEEDPASLVSNLTGPHCWDRHNLAAAGGVDHFWYAARRYNNTYLRSCPRTTDGDAYGYVPGIQVKTIYETLGAADYIDKDFHFSSDRMRMSTTECPDETEPCDGVSGGNVPATIEGTYYSRVSIDECRQVSLDFCPGATKHADYTYGWDSDVFDQMQRECLGIPVDGIEPEDGPAECNAGQIDRYTSLKYGTLSAPLQVWTEPGCTSILYCTDATPSVPTEMFATIPDEQSGETHIGHGVE